MLSQVQTGVVSRCWGRRLTVMVMQMKRATFWLNTESMRRLSQSKRRCLHGRMCPQTCTQWSNNTGVFTHVRRAASSHRRNPEPSECCLLIQEQHHMCESRMSHGHLGGAQDKDDKRFDSGFSIMGCGCKLLQTNLSPVLRVDWASGDQVSLKKSCSSLFDMCSWHKIKYNLFNYLGGKIVDQMHGEKRARKHEPSQRASPSPSARPTARWKRLVFVGSVRPARLRPSASAPAPESGSCCLLGAAAEPLDSGNTDTSWQWRLRNY